MAFSATASAECRDPSYIPFSGDVKLICTIKWKRAGVEDSALLAPLDNERWVAWIHSSIYETQAVPMTVTANSCEGLALVGRYKKNRSPLPVV